MLWKARDDHKHKESLKKDNRYISKQSRWKSIIFELKFYQYHLTNSDNYQWVSGLWVCYEVARTALGLLFILVTQSHSVEQKNEPMRLWNVYDGILTLKDWRKVQSISLIEVPALRSLTILAARHNLNMVVSNKSNWNWKE